jgi:hypothetical protein
VVTVTLTVRKVNRPPVARDDAYKTAQERALRHLRAGRAGQRLGSEGARLRATLVRPAAHGLVRAEPRGAVRLPAEAGFTAPTLSRTRGATAVQSSNTATVTVTVGHAIDGAQAARQVLRRLGARVKRRAFVLPIVLCGGLLAKPLWAQPPDDRESAIRALEEQERQAVLRSDADALERLWSPRMIVNTPRARSLRS